MIYKFLTPFLAPVSCILALCFMLVNIALWLGPEYAEFPARAYSGMPESDFNLTLGNRLFGALISSLHLGVLAFGLLSVARIFKQLNRSEWFVPQFSQHLRRFGLSLVAFTLMIPLVQVFMSLALTYNNPVGQRMISLDVDSSTAPIAFVLLLIGVLLSLIASVMARAGVIATEYEKIV